MEEKVIKALGDPKRWRILELMHEEGCCVSALAVRCELSESAVSQHLKVLREADLVQGIKFGYYTHYRINYEAVQKVIDELSLLTRPQKKKCSGTFKGCSVADRVQCKNVHPEGSEEKK